MRLKLDENLDVRLAHDLAAGGDDVDTVLEERLVGGSDEAIFAASLASRRTLVTLDLHFADPLRFPPRGSAGIVVLRPPRAVLPLIRATLESVLPRLRSLSLEGQLVIVEPGRLRLWGEEA
jgi:predicted nuclease of predicted toxin-antitoxin system